jgi:site-specific recombinase XerD
MMTPPTLAALVERFFMQRLMQQRQASPHTISSYRDTFRQFLMFVQQQRHRPPSRLNFEEIDARWAATSSRRNPSPNPGCTYTQIG